jgi:hypothetical protein
MPPEPTYFVQIADPEEPERWHTVARVEGKALANEVVRLAHAEWELGMGEYRHYGRALVERAEANLSRG